ncbi:MAG: AAA family ATPase [Candidatus Woesearchaeota archaeon]|nr:AAA family ATPase [Candidatus Woesearchaeota archaeon]
MALFKDILRSDESIFQDTVALDYDYIPKLVPFREKEQRFIASCIKPLFQKRNGKNVLIYGRPGVGKTVATRHVVNELEEETVDIIPIYINCWQRNSSYKIMLELCSKLDYKFTQNKKTDELFDIVKEILNKKSAVFVFDEIDKAEDVDFIYFILENIYRKTVIIVTNYKSWLEQLDERLKSRLLPELVEFSPYDEKETYEILKRRLEYAFVSGVWDEDAFGIIAKKSAELGDIRTGLFLMKEAGNCAENKSSRKIKIEHAKEALKKLENFSIKSSDSLEDDEKLILSIIKQNSGKKIGDLFDIYQKKSGQLSYKTFQRKIADLEKNKFVDIKKIIGSGGSTSIITYQTTKKLTEF